MGKQTTEEMGEASRDAALSHLQAYRRRLDAQLQELQQRIDALDLSIQLITTHGHPALEQLGPRRRSKYASLPTQRAVEQFMRDHPNETLKAADVARGLVEVGFVPRAKNFSSQVTVALNRLARISHQACGQPFARWATIRCYVPMRRA